MKLHLRWQLLLALVGFGLILAILSFQEPEPQVVFYASGETTPGSMELRDEDSGELLWRLEWDLLGRFEVLRDGEAPGEPL